MWKVATGKSNDYQIAFYLLMALYFFMQVSFAARPGILTDDMMHYLYFKKYNAENISLKNVLSDYLADPNRYSRPLSAVAISLITVLSFKSKILFFCWGCLNMLYVFLLKKILEHYFPGNYLFILLCCAAVLFFPLSSANHFSVIMQAAQFVVGLFLSAITLVRKRSVLYSALAGFLILCSLLIYELNFFLIPIPALLIYFKEKKRLQKIFWSCIMPVILFAFYRVYLVKIIFTQYYDYAGSRLEFSLKRCFELFYSFAKLFTIDFYYLVLQSIRVGQFSKADFCLFFAGVAISFLAAFKLKYDRPLPKRALVFFTFCFFLSCLVFIFSPYPPVAFGFENRILLWVRYTSSLLFVAIIIGLIGRFTALSYMFRSILFLGLACSIGVVLAEKNGWYAASEYDRQLIESIDARLKNMPGKKILIMEDFRKKNNLVAYETTIRASYQIDLAKKLYGSPELRPASIVIAQPHDYSLYEIGNKTFNNRYKTTFTSDSSGITANKSKLNFPFYIYDVRSDKIKLITDSHDFREVIKSSD